MYKAIHNMNISTEKLDIIQRICEIQDNDLIDLIKNIIDIFLIYQVYVNHAW